MSTTRYPSSIKCFINNSGALTLTHEPFSPIFSTAPHFPCLRQSHPRDDSSGAHLPAAYYCHVRECLLWCVSLTPLHFVVAETMRCLGLYTALFSFSTLILLYVTIPSNMQRPISHVRGERFFKGAKVCPIARETPCWPCQWSCTQSLRFTGLSSSLVPYEC
jgi:hypothetical protein